jgi:hypothetical protein
MNRGLKIPLTGRYAGDMNNVMAERIRIIIDTEEEVRLAVRLAATKADLTASQLINGILRRALAGEIADAKKYLPKKKGSADDRG